MFPASPPKLVVPFGSPPGPREGDPVLHPSLEYSFPSILATPLQDPECDEVPRRSVEGRSLEPRVPIELARRERSGSHDR